MCVMTYVLVMSVLQMCVLCIAEFGYPLCLYSVFSADVSVLYYLCVLCIIYSFFISYHNPKRSREPQRPATDDSPHIEVQ